MVDRQRLSVTRIHEIILNQVEDYEISHDPINAFGSDRLAQLAYAVEGARGRHCDLHRS
jgi:hypothetical protein